MKRILQWRGWGWRSGAAALGFAMIAFPMEATAQAGMRFGPPLPPEALPRTLRLEDVLPTSVLVTINAGMFFLEHGEGVRYGPFNFGDGSPVPLGNTPFTLRTEDGERFTLFRPADGMTFGPFLGQDGAAVSIGRAELRFRRPRTAISGQLDIQGVSTTRVSIALVRMEDNTATSLARARIEFLQIGAALNESTASRRFDAPVVMTQRGPLYDPVVRRSSADVARAEATAHRKARETMEALLRENNARATAVAVPNGRFEFTDLPSGRYFVCLIAEVRDPESGRNPRFEPRIWWADFPLEENDVGTVVFSGNGRDWRDLYR